MKSGALVPCPNEHNVVSSNCKFKLEKDERNDASLGLRFNARMVARGFSQIEGVDYSERYPPVVEFTSFRILLSMCHRRIITFIEWTL